MIKIENKKADLMNNVLTTLIAVVGLVIIFFAAWQLWSAYASQAEKNAQISIDSIEARVNALEEAKDYKTSTQVSLPIRGIKDWFVAGWSKDDAERPDNCYFKSCICICPVGSTDFYDADAKISVTCRSQGFCRLFDADRLGFEGQPFVVCYDRDDDEEIVMLRPAVVFKTSKFIELKVRKYAQNNKHIIAISLW